MTNAQPKRVASLIASATEIVCELALAFPDGAEIPGDRPRATT
jgi:hypothetical protein